MRFEVLKTAVHLFDSKDMLKTGQELYLDGGTVRLQITKLEKELGYSLFNRNGGSTWHVEPTERAYEFFNYISESVKIIDATLHREWACMEPIQEKLANEILTEVPL